MKPMLASDFDESKLRFPLIAQPKIDGVRGLNTSGVLTGRSLKQHANTYTTQFYSRPEYTGFDGELAAEHECNPDLCRITTSALSTIDGQPFTLWHVFDLLTPDALSLNYEARYLRLLDHVVSLQRNGYAGHLRVVPAELCRNLDDLLTHDTKWLDMGYEGTIIRNPLGMHKQGRSTVREGGLLRIKRFIDAEIRVGEIIEGETNLNEAKTNELGLTERSTHQENMVPNGMLGKMRGYLLADVIDPTTKKVLFQKGETVTVGAGRMPHDKRKHYFEHPDELLGSTVKFQLFPKGIKDKPRFPTYQSHRASSDM